MEIWKDIEGSLYYQVSNTGKVKSLEHKRWCIPNNSFSIIKERILKLSNNNTKKYWRIKIKYKTGLSYTQSVHRLVAIHFIPNPNNKPQVNHIDSNKDNNNDWNLEWVTNLENMIHSNLDGKREQVHKAISGESSIMNKHSEEKLKQIPILIEKGLTYIEIGKELNIPPTLISEIKYGRAWRRLGLVIPDSKNYIFKSLHI